MFFFMYEIFTTIFRNKKSVGIVLLCLVYVILSLAQQSFFSSTPVQRRLEQAKIQMFRAKMIHLDCSTYLVASDYYFVLDAVYETGSTA